MVLLTLNILMGLLVSVNYNPKTWWPHKKLPFPFWKLHNWNGYIAISQRPMSGMRKLRWTT